jgi:hypothetical protein
MSRRPAGAAVAALILLAACTHHTTAPAGDGSIFSSPAPGSAAAAWAAAANPKLEACGLRTNSLDKVRALSPTPSLVQAYRSKVPALVPTAPWPQPGTNPHYYAARYQGAPVGVVVVDQSGPRGLPTRVAFVFSAQGKLVQLAGRQSFNVDLPSPPCPIGGS